METDVRRPRRTDVPASSSHLFLDYYLIQPEKHHGETPAAPVGVLVEEFELASDHTALALGSARWTVLDGWVGAAPFSRRVRTDAGLRSRIATADRDEVVQVYRRLGGGDLPDEQRLRSHFGAAESLATAPPLRLGAGEVPEGFHSTRFYRILFVNDLPDDGLARLRARWQMRVSPDADDPRARVAGSAELRVADDHFRWDLRRVGPGVAWCLDLTADLGSRRADRIGPVLRGLTAVMRQQGLIPVTIERFS
ncbi:hypothetical protein [Micromonospora sp. NBC_01796]|uniref:hypothetical protein n=1 Tax=Micromonospora sp. NBC_01796 TaxID=2975987 RepID=UPI002DD7A4FE|nr:hypothetical protein [Micromonospora sp. NBC_01796]WSA85662.1 hypothetical protein OIE47_35845 [Micromonospora sp. NBC_01796]